LTFIIAVFICYAISRALSGFIASVIGKNFFYDEKAEVARASPPFLKKASDERLSRQVYISISETKLSLSISMK
jgi:hypothetical protein